jgi:hypothetical protein
MKLRIPRIDRRHQLCGGLTVVDEDTGQSVGCEYLGEDGLGRELVLFDRYHGTFATQAECQAFADGVASVINDMIAPRKKRSQSKAA